MRSACGEDKIYTSEGNFLGCAFELWKQFMVNQNFNGNLKY